ncbi:transposase [Limosilactobacillus reuteri]|uniref:IS4 family transposase n=1 Tax=Limosilactobacillus reuteri TaxID=1598 RepID=UPI0015FA9AAC|nr:transposase [Limosilactobacillus reuteri]MBB1071710.1 transposase [Limosilactobacillus reuteri]MCC4511477.1 transposase [Limosilactobacillus reuteri]MCC4512802.1 transposase [Limosilactobacillus reuteri]
MKSINQIQAEHDTKNIISAFIHLIGLGRLSKRINFKHHSTIPLTAVITWLFEAIFSRRSLYRAQPSRWFSSRTARNILNDGRINWQKLLCLVAIKMILILTPFIDQRRRLALIVDDTLIERAYSTKTELLAKIYDHDQHRYSTGYRNLIIGWSDGNTFLPVNCALMSTRKKTNLVGSKSSITDQRTIAGQRRSQAQRKMNEVVLELISQALRLGVTAKYVLFDSWYSSPQMFWHLKELGLESVAMLKRSSKVYYRYRGRNYSIKALYQRLLNSKRPAGQSYLYSSIVEANFQGQVFPVKIVFVAKKGVRNQYLVLASTNTNLTPQQIIQLYSRRWSIETYFKTAKQYLRLNKSQIQSYDGQVAQITVTAMTYILLAWQERLNKDDRTLGDLFYLMNDSLPEIKFIEALVYLLKTFQSQEAGFISQTINQFLAYLPRNVQNILQKVV